MPEKKAKKAANKAGLNAKQRLEGKGKYSEEAKNKKKNLYRGKKLTKKMHKRRFIDFTPFVPDP